MRYAITLIIIGGALLVAGCHTMHFELADAEYEHVVYERKSYFLWGLVPTVEVDASKHCPTGTAAIREQTTFTDGLLALLTLGIWEPRSSWYYCLSEPEGGAQ